jgi:hypothetical protein
MLKSDSYEFLARVNHLPQEYLPVIIQLNQSMIPTAVSWTGLNVYFAAVIHGFGTNGVRRIKIKGGSDYVEKHRV